MVRVEVRPQLYDFTAVSPVIPNELTFLKLVRYTSAYVAPKNI
jgi:hypothetical protein